MFSLDRETAKKYVGGVVAFGAGAIVKTIISKNVKGANIVDKTGVMIGSWALGALAGDASKKYVDELLDTIFDVYERFYPPQEETYQR